MECLNNLVSYNTACLENGTAKYLIQNLPAISTQFAANVAGYDDVSAKKLFENILNFNANLISERVRTMLNGLVVPSDIFSTCVCNAPSDLSGVTFQTKTVHYGVQLILNNVSRSGYFFIENIRVLCQNSATNIVFSIVEQDGETTNITVNNIIGNKYNTIELNYKVKTNKVLIYTEGLNLARFVCFESVKGCGCGGGNPQNRSGAEGLQNQFMSVYDYDSANPTAYNTDGFVTGIQPCLSFKCDTDSIVCRQAERFALPLLYFTGASLIEQSFTSERLNITTITDSDMRNKTIEDYYKKGNAYLENAAISIENALRQNTQDACIICTGRRTGWASN